MQIHSEKIRNWITDARKEFNFTEKKRKQQIMVNFFVFVYNCFDKLWWFRWC